MTRNRKKYKKYPEYIRKNAAFIKQKYDLYSKEIAAILGVPASAVNKWSQRYPYSLRDLQREPDYLDQFPPAMQTLINTAEERPTVALYRTSMKTSINSKPPIKDPPAEPINNHRNPRIKELLKIDYMDRVFEDLAVIEKEISILEKDRQRIDDELASLRSIEKDARAAFLIIETKRENETKETTP